MLGPMTFIACVEICPDAAAYGISAGPTMSGIAAKRAVPVKMASPEAMSVMRSTCQSATVSGRSATMAACTIGTSVRMPLRERRSTKTPQVRPITDAANDWSTTVPPSAAADPVSR
jgi:hypothetical protein